MLFQLLNEILFKPHHHLLFFRIPECIKGLLATDYCNCSNNSDRGWQICNSNMCKWLQGLLTELHWVVMFILIHVNRHWYLQLMAFLANFSLTDGAMFLMVPIARILKDLEDGGILLSLLQWWSSINLTNI